MYREDFKLNSSSRDSLLGLIRENKCNQIIEQLDQEDTDFRNRIKNRFDEINENLQVDAAQNQKRNKYYFDVEMGLTMYDIITIPEFGMRRICNQDFWAYISLNIVPDLVAQRWGNENAEKRFIGSFNRMWLSSIWWYIHLSYMGSIDKTKSLLEKNFFNTDTILNFVDRTGGGYRVDIYRMLIRKFAEYSDYAKISGTTSMKYFRNIMKMYLAKSMTVLPDLCDKGADGFITSIFNDAGVLASD